MKALVFDHELTIKEVEKPRRKNGEVLIRVTRAGICNTDHEITRGYSPDFKGILGHEFIGIAEEADDQTLIGKRVTAEINATCGTCEFCKKGMGRHCLYRTVMGITARNGAFAQWICVPTETVVLIPDDIPDSTAVFIEPLAAACEILEQLPIGGTHSVLVIGDGKLASLIGLVLKSTGCRMMLVGRHVRKLRLLKQMGIEPTVVENAFPGGTFDITIEASGNPEGFALAVANTRPRGTVVLKSTYAQRLTIDATPIVINELTILGSRCGRFADAIAFLQKHRPALDKLITDYFPLDQGLAAFARSGQKDAMKVILTMTDTPAPQ